MPRPTTSLISREKAARVALEIIDAEGLEALSLDRIGQRLQVRGPSLYHHFSGKGDILSEVVLLILRDTPVPDDVPANEWREWHLQMSLNFRGSIMNHYRAAPLLLQFLPRRLLIPTFERSGSILTRAGVPDSMHVVVWDGLEKLTLGSALYASAARSGYWESFSELDVGTSPHLTKALAASSLGSTELFSAAVMTFLHGVPDQYRVRDGRRSRRRAKHQQ